jgi:hypothetical protein
MKYVAVVVLTLFIYSCENTRHSIGITGKPLATGNKFEDSVKFNYKIVFGQIRSKKTEEDDD